MYWVIEAGLHLLFVVKRVERGNVRGPALAVVGSMLIGEKGYDVKWFA